MLDGSYDLVADYGGDFIWMAKIASAPSRLRRWSWSQRRFASKSGWARPTTVANRSAS